jgi:hypothetical protein
VLDRPGLYQLGIDAASRRLAVDVDLAAGGNRITIDTRTIAVSFDDR